jgi:predicted site-specific integrase-resolvase
MQTLLTSREVDRLLRYAAGQTVRLAKRGLIPFIRLPDGAMRFDESAINELLTNASKVNRMVRPHYPTRSLSGTGACRG